MKKTFVLLIILSAFQLCAKDKLIVVQDLWPPYTTGIEGQFPSGGFGAGIAKELFKKLNVDYEFTLLPWKRCLELTKSGKADLILILTKNDERASYMDFSKPYIDDRDLVWYYSESKSGPKEWNALEDLKVYKIGKTAGFNYGEDFNNATLKFSFNIDEANSDLKNFEKLIHERTDVFICNETVAFQIFKENPKIKQNVTAAKKPLKEVSFSVGFSKKSKYLKYLPQVDKILSDFQNDGTMKKLLER